MIYDSIIVRCGEMFLKKGHLPYFENKLLQNSKAITGISAITRLRGRLILPYFSHHSSLRRVFGISSYSLASAAEKSLDAIQEAVAKVLHEKPATTFKIETIRSDKTFPLESRQVNIAVGQYIEKTTAWQCEFNTPDVLVKIEINRKGAFIFTETIPGPGGLPVGTAGKVHLLLDDEADLLAGLLMMKRGCDVIPIGVGKEPEISLLQKFSAKKIKNVIIENEKELQDYIEKNNISVVVTGETFEKREKCFTTILVFRPLIAYTQGEIHKLLSLFSG